MWTDRNRGELGQQVAGEPAEAVGLAEVAERDLQVADAPIGLDQPPGPGEPTADAVGAGIPAGAPIDVRPESIDERVGDQAAEGLADPRRERSRRAASSRIGWSSKGTSPAQSSKATSCVRERRRSAGRGRGSTAPLGMSLSTIRLSADAADPPRRARRRRSS